MPLTKSEFASVATMMLLIVGRTTRNCAGWREGQLNLFDRLRGGSEQDLFAKRVIRRLRQRGWRGKIVYDRNQFVLRLDNEHALFLGNALRAWKAATATTRDGEIDTAIGFLFEDHRDTSFDACGPRLLPVIRGRAHIANAWMIPALATGPDSYDGAWKPFCEGLAVLVAIDSPTSIQLLNSSRMSEWAMSFDQVLDVAMENLRALSPCQFERQNGGFHLSTYGDHYDASRILLPHLFDQLPLRGDPVAVVVAREGLVVAGSDDLAALDAMAAYVEEEIERAMRPVSTLPIILQGGEWRLMPTHAPELSALDRLRIRQKLTEYSDQKEVLQGYVTAQGRELYVAETQSRRDGDRLMTWAAWTEEVPTLLPVADIIIVNPTGGPPIARRWSDVEAVCGPFVVEPATYPARWVVETWPGPDVLARLRDRERPSGFPADFA